MFLIPNQKEIFFLVKKNLTQKSFILVYVYYMGSQIALNFWMVVVRSVSSKKRFSRRRKSNVDLTAVSHIKIVSK